MNVNKALPLSAVRVTGGFWRERINNIAEQVIPYQWKALNDQIPGAEPSHAIENFRIASGESSGRFYGLIFQDSDVGKWIEAASYSLVHHPSPDLETTIDAVIELIGKTQDSDGYLDTYFQVAAPERRWTDFAMGHEMYCGGHLIEGAVAYFKATGKRPFLEIMMRYADHLDRRFGPAPAKQVAYCGHPEIELALFKLYEATGEERYRELSKFFIEARGRHPEVIDNDKTIDWGGGGNNSRWHQHDYYQDHAPVRQQDHADGHAVRAMYLYSGMADQWRLTGDETLGDALKTLWKNATEKRMYVTGGLGSQAHCERFTVDYDLPSDTAYTETCAAIGLIFWAWRMTLASPDRRYADVLERALYNGALSGISLDGTRYFYVNPLEVIPSVAQDRKDHEHVVTERVSWFGCSCCPPNIARLVCSVGQFLYSHTGRTLWVHQYASGTAEVDTAEGRFQIEQDSEYPWNGAITIKLGAVPNAEPWTVCVRIPPNTANAVIRINGTDQRLTLNDAGYAVLTRNWSSGEVIELTFEMPVRWLRSHPNARETAGLVAVQRGPFVYCAEEADNGPSLHLLSLDTKAPLHVEADEIGGIGMRKLVAAGRRVVVEDTPLYSEQDYKTEPCKVTLVPYFAWNNRGRGEMRVWLGAN
jgi:DUF1680 family protein